MKQHAPATARNREPLLAVLARVLPRAGRVLEIASGTGEHARFFAHALPSVDWQPSDVDPLALASIAAHRDEARLPNLLAPVELDVTSLRWPVERAEAVVCINMLHIAPWSACQGLMTGAARVLPVDAPLVLYGPYRFDGVFTAPSNETFDAALRDRNPSWGVRDLSLVTRRAEEAGFERTELVAMPANNHTVVFVKR
jgi:hypothetical protein